MISISAFCVNSSRLESRFHTQPWNWALNRCRITTAIHPQRHSVSVPSSKLSLFGIHKYLESVIYRLRHFLPIPVSPPHSTPHKEPRTTPPQNIPSATNSSSAIMKGFTLPKEHSRSYLPCSYTTSESTFYSRLRRIFKGPPQSAAPPQQWKDEKKYQHVPTHAKASFMKTATNPAMLGPHFEKIAKENKAEPPSTTLPRQEISI